MVKGKPSCKHFNLNEKCKDCKTLLKRWNEKLENSGLFDHEEKEIQRQYQLSENRDTLVQQHKFSYFQRIALKADKEAFDNDSYALIMKQRGEGSRISEIVRALEVTGEKLNRETVRHIIRRFEHKWSIRKWTWKEMGLKPPTRYSLSKPLFYHFNIAI